MWDISSAKENTHVFSESLDVLAFTVPILMAVVIAPFAYFYIPHDVIPFWAYVAIVVLTDVGHVWSTMFRTHFDSVENSRRSWLYNGSPVALFLVQLAAHYYDESVFWTMLGYLAIYHFAKQQYGLMMLAKIRSRDFQGMQRDKWLLFSGAIIPVCLWHCDSTRKFDWFNREDPFLLGVLVPQITSTPLSSAVPIRLYDVFAVAYVVAFGYLLYQIYTQMSKSSAASLKHLIIFFSWVSWAVGVLVNHKVIALSFLNLFHAFPAYVIVFCSTRNRWWNVNTNHVSKKDDDDAPVASPKKNSLIPSTIADSFSKWMTQSNSMIIVYILFLMGLGAAEEFLWEAMVWQDYTSHMWEWDPMTDFHPFWYSATCSLLILPQSTHYFLDAFIWKMGKNEDGSEQNPHLKKYLALQL